MLGSNAVVDKDLAAGDVELFATNRVAGLRVNIRLSVSEDDGREATMNGDLGIYRKVGKSEAWWGGPAGYVI